MVKRYMSNRWVNICTVCNYNLKWEIENRPEEYVSCNTCGGVCCTHHEGIGWEDFTCPKCVGKEE